MGVLVLTPVLQACIRKGTDELASNLFPNRVHGTGDVRGAGLKSHDTSAQGILTIQRMNDVQNLNAGGRAGESHAARGTFE